MRVIVPGGFYSHNAAQKKIWLDYSYYGLGVENVESIRNLTRNSIIYSVKRSIPGITFSNGCITYSRDCYSEDLDKLQIILRTPVPDSLELLEATEGVITLETEGKVLVLPTRNAAILPHSNEYTLSKNKILNDFGGIFGQKDTTTSLSSVAPYSTSVPYTSPNNNGPNLEFFNAGHTSRIRQSGLIKRVVVPIGGITNMTVFVVKIWRKNGSTYDVISVSENLASLLSIGVNTIDLSVPISAQEGDFYGVFMDNGSVLSVVATGGSLKYLKPSSNTGLGESFDWDTSATGTVAGKQYPIILYMDSPDVVFIGDSTNAGHPGHYTFIEATNTTNLVSQTPYHFANDNNITYQNMGIGGQNCAAIRARFEADVIALNPKIAVIETGLNEGDNIADTATQLSILEDISEMITLCNNNNIIPILFEVPPATVDSELRANGRNTVNAAIHDLQNSLDFFIFENRTSVGVQNPETGKWSIQEAYDCGDGLHYSVAGYTKLGTDLYKSLSARSNTVSYIFDDSLNFVNGLQNITKPWLALYDPATSLIDFYLHTNRPTSLSFKRNEAGTIHELKLYPGSGSIYHGQLTFADLSLDSDSDLIPDCLEASVSGSITQFLKNYGMVI